MCLRPRGLAQLVENRSLQYEYTRSYTSWTPSYYVAVLLRLLREPDTSSPCARDPIVSTGTSPKPPILQFYNVLSSELTNDLPQ